MKGETRGWPRDGRVSNRASTEPEDKGIHTVNRHVEHPENK